MNRYFSKTWFAALIFAGFMSGLQAYAGSVACGHALVSQNSGLEPALEELADLRLSLDRAVASGQSAFETGLLAQEFEQKLKEVASASGLSVDDVLKQKILLLQGRPVLEREVKARQVDFMNGNVLGRRAIFHTVAPGHFRRTIPNKKIYAEITKPFEMMATPVTQLIYAEVVRTIEAVLGRTDLSTNPSAWGDVHTWPVENVSYDTIQKWLEGLNKLSKRGIAIGDVFQGHKPGDVYRLPTEAEWEFVITKRGLCNTVYHFGDDEAQMVRYGWTNLDSSGHPQPVGTKEPLVIDHCDFYDFHGNVSEWVQDSFVNEPPGGQDPSIKSRAGDRVIRGGSFFYSPIVSSSKERYPRRSDDSSTERGFRLVRVRADQVQQSSWLNIKRFLNGGR